MDRKWKKRILWTGLVALGSASLPMVGVDMEKFTIPAWIVSALWAVWITVAYYEFKPVVLGWFGKLHKPTDSELWEEDKGRGDLAAPLIRSAQGFARAEKIFNHCRYDKQPRAMPMARKAMVNRLITEGRTEETMRFLKGEKLGIYQITVGTPPKKGFTDGLYFGLVMEFQLRDKVQT